MLMRKEETMLLKENNVIEKKTMLIWKSRNNVVKREKQRCWHTNDLLRNGNNVVGKSRNLVEKTLLSKRNVEKKY